ncbi:MAG: FAD-dependent oxidoreductase, partial [Alphaproteobacteria bacterium]|nr:FAD-dependent oxidoreductase [Alphaproteobacteria bacterium]
MPEIKTDIVILGAGIAGLWLFHHLKRQNHNVLLLESQSIGGIQSVASQGIIHSGLKYCLAGKINKLAQSISDMPQIWRECLNGEGPVDLSSAIINAQSQNLLIPEGIMGDLVKLATKKALGNSVHDIKPDNWPEQIKNSGFSGSVIAMNELVLDVPSIIKALAEPYKESIRKLPAEYADNPFEFLKSHNIETKRVIFTAAQNNLKIARTNQNDDGLETQHRPLLQIMIKNAPFELYAHLVGKTDKPI